MMAYNTYYFLSQNVGADSILVTAKSMTNTGNSDPWSHWSHSNRQYGNIQSFK